MSRPFLPGSHPLSLATRLSLWYGISTFLLLALASGFLYWALVTNLDREDDEFLADKVRFLRQLLSKEPADADMLREEVQWEPAARQHGQVYVRVLGPEGRPLLETPGMSALLPPQVFPRAASTDQQRGEDVTTAATASFRVLTAAAPRPSGETASIQMALDRTHEEHLLANYRRALWLVLAVGLVLCAVAGQRLARRGLRPLVEMGTTAGRIRSTTLHERMDSAGLPAELLSLAETFNDMLERLQESFERLARFSADIAHELRNPVNNLRGEAEVALGKPRTPAEYREVLASSLEECGRLAALIDNLLFVARAEDPRTQVAKEPMDVARELAAVRDFYEAAAADAGVTLTLSAPATLPASLDRTLFQRAMGNLVANALAHTPAGGEVTLTAAASGDAVEVEVRDTGAGIATEHLPHVFDRFYRADPARTTAAGHVGLGLAIVKAIAGLHRGTVSLDSTLGKGTRVRLCLPRGGAAAG